MSLCKLWELLMARESWCPPVHEVAKSRTQLSNWTEMILTGVSWYFTVVLICFLSWLVMLNMFFETVGHLYVFFRKISIQILSPIFSWIVRDFLVSFCWILWVLYAFWILTLIQYVTSKYFLPFSSLPVHFVDEHFTFLYNILQNLTHLQPQTGLLLES